MPTAKEITSNAASRRRKLPLLFVVCLALTILVFATFWQLKDAGFINIDDDVYVYKNVQVQSGLGWNGIKQAFSSELVAKSANWHPLTWLSLMLDRQMFGLDPRGYHLVNLLFHVFATLLLFLVFHRMTGMLWRSAFVAALFAVHPLHVESVAWIAERKDALSACFWMLTMGAYGYYVENPGWRRYVLVLLFFALGLMAKPMLVTLPFVLLLMDYWPLKRFSGMKKAPLPPAPAVKPAAANKQRKKSPPPQALKGKPPRAVGEKGGEEFTWTSLSPLLKEKIPLFALAILSSAITYIAQQQGGAVQSADMYPLAVRIGNALISYVAYLGKTVWPLNLAVFYPHPQVLPAWQAGGALLLAAITGALVPVIGIVQVGSQAMTDRYTYIPLIGIFVVAAWGIPDILKKWRYRKEALAAAAALSVLFLAVISWTQVGYWQNSITLLDHTLKVTGYRNIAAYANLGVAYADLGNYQQAIAFYNQAIATEPGYAKSYNNRGMAYASLGNYRQAMADYGRAIAVKPGHAAAYLNRGGVYVRLGKNDLAVADLKTAARLGNERARKLLQNQGLGW